MTRKQLERIVQEWQSRLGLTHWDLKINWDEPTDDDALASMFRSNIYDWCELKLAAGWPKWEPKFANQTIVHELIHLHTRDVEEAFKSAGPSEDVSRQQTREVEKLVDRLACRLVDLVGVA